MSESVCPYVSRGGWKLAAALDAFALHIQGWVCADLGCSTGGFTDCLLQHGAAQVFAVDTAYGQLAYKLRSDPRVTVCERSNALHLDPRKPRREMPRPLARSASAATPFTGCDLVVIDLGWTRQALAIPAALRWLRDPRAGTLPYIITLIKPHYEAPGAQVRGKRRGILPDAEAQRVCEATLAQLPALGVRVLGCIPAPIRGLAAGNKPGNQEYLALLQPSPAIRPSM